MDKLYEKRFEIVKTPNGQIIYWKDFLGVLYDIGVTAPFVFLVGLVMLMTVWGVSDVIQVLLSEEGYTNGTALFHILGGIFITLVASVVLLYYVRPIESTRLELLGDGSILFTQGTYTEAILTTDNEHATGIVWRGKPAQYFDREKIRSDSLELKNKKRTLILTYESQEIELGEGLSKPAREWLFTMLKEHLFEQEPKTLVPSVV